MTAGREQVVRWVMRLVDYGKGMPDDYLEGKSLGDIADEIIALTAPNCTCRMEGLPEWWNTIRGMHHEGGCPMRVGFER